MTSRPTDHANRDLWQFHLDVVNRRAGGQVIWQPRFGCWYDDRIFRGEALPGRLRGLDMPGIYKSLGVSNRVYHYGACFVMEHDPRVRTESRELSPLEIERTITTPVGTLTSLSKRNTSNPGEFPVKWWISSEQDMKIHQWLLEHATWRFDQEKYDQIAAQWGFAGAPTMNMPRITVQSLYVETMGTEAGIYALIDYPGTVEKYFAAMNENHMRLAEVIADSPVDIITYGDNVHCGLFTPEIFEKYLMPAYIQRNAKLRAAGKFTCSHWDGDTRWILPYAREAGLSGIEAVTPLPQGDVTLREVKAAFGDDIFLLDGLAALLFDPTYSEAELIAQTEECLELFAGQLILGISDEIPSTGLYERIDIVTRIVDDYNAGRG